MQIGGFVGKNGMEFSPISGYNNFLENNNSFEFDSGSQFEDILAQKVGNVNPAESLQGGVSINDNTQRFFVENATGVQQTDSAGAFFDSMGKSFGNALGSVNDKITDAHKSQKILATGGNIEVHDVMIAAQKANLSMQMAIQLRNKMVSAYKEISQVRV